MRQQAQLPEPITDFWKSGITAWQQLNQTNQQLWQDFAKQQFDFATLCADYGRREMELCMSGKSPEGSLFGPVTGYRVRPASRWTCPVRRSQ